MRNYTFRLTPGQDLLDSIEAFVREKRVEAGCILSGIGSLRRGPSVWRTARQSRNTRNISRWSR
jgi:predicted DNA-binding protein with PD1-like motif